MGRQCGTLVRPVSALMFSLWKEAKMFKHGDTVMRILEIA
jgi:hypothetical protein